MVVNTTVVVMGCAMNRQELVADLMALGLSQYESQVYIALVAESPVTAYQLARNAGIATSKVYETIAKLQERDLIATIWGDPRQYVPQEPAHFVANAKSSYLATLDRLQSGLARLAQPQQPNYVWNLDGRTEILTLGERILSNANRAIVGAAPGDFIRAWYTALTAAHNRAVRVELLTNSTDTLPGTLPVRCAMEVPGRSQLQRVVLVVDSNTALLAGVGDGEGESANDVQGAWTRHQAIVSMAEEFVQNKLFLEEIISQRRILWEQDD